MLMGAGRAGEGVSVLVIGGSVSAGAGQPRNDPQRAWVPRLFQWIRQTFPHGRHRLVNHAIGATRCLQFPDSRYQGIGFQFLGFISYVSVATMWPKV